MSSDRLETLYDSFESFKSFKIVNVKYNVKSIDCCESGNLRFSAKLWCDAMECYNQALCFAKSGSELIGFAHANRSSCSLAMKMFKKCLNDIELAKENHYPQEKWKKLDQREVKCLNLMTKEEDKSEFYNFKLDFEANEQFPCLANVLRIENNSEYGRHIVATDDIDVGKIVMVEPSYAG